MEMRTTVMGWGIEWKWPEGCFLGNRNVLYLVKGVVTLVHALIKTHQLISVLFAICKLFFNKKNE